MFMLIVFFLSFFKRCCTPWKQNEGHSQRSRCRKHPILLRYHATVFVCVWVCAWAFVCIHQGVIWNYFWQWRSVLLAIFEGYWFKKKKRPSSISARLPRPPVCIKFSSFGGSGSGGSEQRETEMEQGLAPGWLWHRSSLLAARKCPKAGAALVWKRPELSRSSVRAPGATTHNYCWTPTL